MCACACVCIAATAKDSVFHNGGTLKDGKALEGKELNLCIYLFCFFFYFNNFNLACLELWWTCRKRKES